MVVRDSEQSHFSSQSRWPWFIKFLHGLFALLVTFQIVTGLLGWFLGAFPLFHWHTRCGRVLIVLLALQWIWLVSFPKGRVMLSHFFPLGPVAFKSVLRDIVELQHGRLPDSGVRSGLPSLMHGLFLLSVTIVASAGLTLFGILKGWWSGISPLTLLKVLRWGGLMVATQWIGHVGMALMHAFAGRPLWAIFSLSRADKSL